MQTTELRMRRSADGLMAEGLLIGLWVADVRAAAEYWLLQGARLGLLTLRALFGRPLGLALVAGAVFGGVLALTSRSTAAQERVASARLDESFIVNAAALYRTDVGRWPNRMEVLVPTYLKEFRRDPWGHRYIVHLGPGGFAVVSAGPDGEAGTNDDLVAFASTRLLSPPRLSPEAALGFPGWTFVAGKGAKLTHLQRGVLAAAGLQRNDTVVNVEGRPIVSVDSLVAFYPRLLDSDPLVLDILRGEEPIRMVIGRDYIKFQLQRQ